MKFLHKFWPWKVIDELEATVSRLNVELAQERSRHDNIKIENHAIKSELRSHQQQAVKHQKDARKMAQIIALKGGILGLLMLCLSSSAQPLIRNTVDTNSLGNAPTTAYFLGWDGVLTKPKWAVPPTGTNYWDYNGFLFPILSTVVSNANGFSDPGGLVSQNATNHDWVVGAAITNGGINNLSNYVNALGAAITNGGVNNLSNYVNALGAAITNGGVTQLSNYVNQVALNITNQGTVVSNGVVAHTVTVAGTANQITSSVGTAQTLAANPATTLSLPSPTIFPGQISVVGITNASGNSNSVAIYDAKTNLTYLATGTGALTNNGSGVMGYYNGFADGSNLTNGAINNLSNLVATIGSNDTNNTSTKGLDPLNTANSILVEEFPQNTANSLSLGTHGWYQVKLGSAVVSMTPGVANHPGIFRISTGTVSGDGGVMMLGNTTNSTSQELYPALNATTGWTNTWVFMLGATNDAIVWMGLVNNLVYITTEPADWMGLIIDSNGTSPLYRYESRASSSSSITNGPALDANVWHKFQMWSVTSGTVSFSMDGANVAHITNNFTSLAVSPFVVNKKSAANNNVVLNLDYWSGIMTGLSR